MIPTVILILAVFLFSILAFRVDGQAFEDGAIGNIYVGRFEETCSRQLNEYSSCLDTKPTTGASCFNENVALLECIGDSPNGNCANEFRVSWTCAAFGGTCVSQIANWVGCATDYCAETYLIPYGQCIQEQRKQSLCSTCPILVVDDALVVSKPVCSAFQQDYCDWQACCEPCQYYLNFYGRCMQVNFNVCNNQNALLESCPYVVLDATQPPTGENSASPPAAAPGMLPPTSPTNNDSSPTSPSSTDTSSVKSWIREFPGSLLFTLMVLFCLVRNEM